MYGYNAYQKAARTTISPRSAEHRLLGEVTAALIAADRNPEEKQQQVKALLWNKKVWDNLIIELKAEDNQFDGEGRNLGAARNLSCVGWRQRHKIPD